MLYFVEVSWLKWFHALFDKKIFCLRPIFIYNIRVKVKGSPYEHQPPSLSPCTFFFSTLATLLYYWIYFLNGPLSEIRRNIFSRKVRFQTTPKLQLALLALVTVIHKRHWYCSQVYRIQFCGTENSQKIFKT